MATPTTPKPKRKGAFGILSLLAVLATIVVASPASAATYCLNGDGGTASVIHVDEANGATTNISFEEGVLVVNGATCGSPENITVIESPEGTDKVDNIRFDLAQPFRVNGELVFVNIRLRAGRDKITVLGSNTEDTVKLEPGFLVVNRQEVYPGSDNGIRLIASFGSSDVSLFLDLRGGDDSFRMRKVDGASWRGPVQVKGGPGNDTLLGGPRRQRLLGGPGEDVINAKGGNDTLKGGGDNDFLQGGGGKDTLNGGGGLDTAWGGKGADKFVMNDRATDVIRGNGGRDRCRCDNRDDARGIEVDL